MRITTQTQAILVNTGGTRVTSLATGVSSPTSGHSSIRLPVSPDAYPLFGGVGNHWVVGNLAVHFDTLTVLGIVLSVAIMIQRLPIARQA